jgi:uncharacterized repeat protein (TIGR03847 family)
VVNVVQEKVYFGAGEQEEVQGTKRTGDVVSDSYEWSSVDAFAATAVGVPGARTFFLQVVSAGTALSFKCEKQHVDALATALAGILGDLPPVDSAPVAPVPTPARPEWTIGSIALGVEAPDARVVVVFEELDEQDNHAQIRFSLTLAQAKTFVEQGSALVAAGRPGCMLCGSPIDSIGYHCQCFN